MVIKAIETFYWKEEEKENKKSKDLKIFLSKEEFKQCNDLINLASQSIIEAQEYIREKNDVSSVSLREIGRFVIFYNFFVEFFRRKKKLFENLEQNLDLEKIDIFYNNLTDYEIYKYSINLSIYLCYYLRLNNRKHRDNFKVKMNKYFGYDFTEIPKREQEFIINNIETKEDIAKNRVLLENIFALFVCIYTKVPLFIIGMPGYSKSLSVELLYKSMKGEISDNFLFKSLPQLIMNSYQGSLGITSEEVLKIFKRARRIFKRQCYDNLSKIISIFFFDDMGIAEKSPNNPLKILPLNLEYEYNEGRKKIAFVGISNSPLNPLIMDKGLHISIPQLDFEELKYTAQALAESYNIRLARRHKDLFEVLTLTYYDYKFELIKKYINKKDFHGILDFYQLIGNAMRSLVKIEEKEQNIDIDENIEEMIGIDSFEKNSEGLNLIIIYLLWK